jgi:hypothetical protein
LRVCLADDRPEGDRCRVVDDERKQDEQRERMAAYEAKVMERRRAYLASCAESDSLVRLMWVRIPSPAPTAIMDVAKFSWFYAPLSVRQFAPLGIGAHLA